MLFYYNISYLKNYLTVIIKCHHNNILARKSCEVILSNKKGCYELNV